MGPMAALSCRLMAALPGPRISETRKTTDGSTELKFRIQFPPAGESANFRFCCRGRRLVGDNRADHLRPARIGLRLEVGEARQALDDRVVDPLLGIRPALPSGATPVGGEQMMAPIL